MPVVDYRAQLHLNGTYVGDVTFQRREDSWAHGQFHPNPAFGSFAECFGRWSLLMHADARNERISEAASDELRRCECEIDRMNAKLHFPATDEWLNCAQLNIDGGLIEWKMY